jgi:tetraacyldisaccharide 4'-kinase
MRAPSFWWRETGLAAAALAPMAALYGAVAAWRMRQPGRRCGVPIVCIGNLTLGGAGKTPTALAVGRLVQAAGRRPFFLSRGYGGSFAGPVNVDPARHTAREVGDEPLLLAKVAPTIVSRDRRVGTQAARAAGADVVVMDDGFQNPAVAKDIAILVVDGGRGIGNGRVFPAGPLRAPLDAQLARAHALVVIGEGSGATSIVAAFGERPVFRGRLVPDAAALARLAGQKVLAFAGLGHPQKFFATLDAAGIAVLVRQSYPDHHRYTAREAAALLAEAEEHGLALLTTEKDLMRLLGDDEAAALAQRARALPVRLVVDDEDGFRRFVLAGLG